MKKIVRLTESDLHKIIKKSVGKIIKENHGEPESYNGLIGSSIIEDYKAQEIADDYGISEEEAAAEWFKNTASPYDFEEGNVPKWREFVMKIPELECEMYHDYGAGYYFLVKDSEPSAAPMAMENKIARVVRENLTRLVNENGATNCASTMQTGSGKAPEGTNPEAGQYTVPFGADKETADRTKGKIAMGGRAKWNVNPGNVQRKPIYKPKG